MASSGPGLGDFVKSLLSGLGSMPSGPPSTADGNRVQLWSTTWEPQQSSLTQQEQDEHLRQVGRVKLAQYRRQKQQQQEQHLQSQQSDLARQAAAAASAALADVQRVPVVLLPPASSRSFADGLRSSGRGAGRDAHQSGVPLAALPALQQSQHQHPSQADPASMVCTCQPQCPIHGTIALSRQGSTPAHGSSRLDPAQAGLAAADVLLTSLQRSRSRTATPAATADEAQQGLQQRNLPEEQQQRQVQQPAQSSSEFEQQQRAAAAAGSATACAPDSPGLSDGHTSGHTGASMRRQRQAHLMTLLPQSGIWQEAAASASASASNTLCSHRVTIEDGPASESPVHAASADKSHVSVTQGDSEHDTYTQEGSKAAGLQSTPLAASQEDYAGQQQPLVEGAPPGVEGLGNDRTTAAAEPAGAVKVPGDPLRDPLVDLLLEQVKALMRERGELQRQVADLSFENLQMQELIGFLSLEQEDGGSSTHEVLSLSADGEEGLTSSLPAAGGGISGTGSGGVLSAGGLGSGSLEGQQSFSNSNGTGNGSGSGSQRGVQAAWAAATQALLSDAAAQHGVYTDSGVPPVLRQHSAAVQAS